MLLSDTTDGIVTSVVIVVTTIAVFASVALVVTATTVSDAVGITAKIGGWKWVFMFRLKLPCGLVFGRIVVGIVTVLMGVVPTVGVSVVIVVVVVRVSVMMVMHCTSVGRGRNGNTWCRAVHVCFCCLKEWCCE